MSASNEWTDWHLTPDGWERGTEKTDFSTERVDPPEDRVKTVRYREYLSSVYSDMSITTKTIWVGDEEEAARLEEEHGPPPNHL